MPDQEDIQRVPNKSAQALYEDAKQTLDSGLYARAIELLSAIDSLLSFWSAYQNKYKWT